jgi:hypothetical protein
VIPEAEQPNVEEIVAYIEVVPVGDLGELVAHEFMLARTPGMDWYRERALLARLVNAAVAANGSTP